MAVKGVFVSDAGALAERPGDLPNSILHAERGGEMPLFALSAGMRSDDISDTTVTWYEQDILYHRTNVTTATDPLGAQLGVEDATWLHENMVLFVEATGEYLLVKAVTGNVITVQRGIGGTPITAINPGGGNDIALQLIGSAFEEASERPTGEAVSPHPRTNITQIFRTAWDISETAKAVNYRFGDRSARNKAHAAMMHAMKMEWSMIWGKRHIGVINNSPFRMMDGILNQIQSNRFVSPGAGLDRRTLDDYVERLFSTNIKGEPNERITFCGNVSLRALNEITWRYGHYNISQGETVFGIKVSKYSTHFGDITLMRHPMMNDNPVWASDIYSFHPAAMETNYLRRTTHKDEMHGSASDLRDATAGVYTTEMTTKYCMEQTGAVMSGVAVAHYTP